MKATAYPHCADRLFGRAHAIEPSALRALIEGPAGRRILAGERPENATDTGGMQAIRTKRLAMVEADPVSVANGCGEYALTSDGVAIVPVMGILSQRFDWLAAICGWTTYEGLAATFAAMLSDYRVRAILMDVDSPGGEAAGMPDCADMILAARDQKPVWAVANTYAASAAYALAGSAEVLFVPRLAQVGSIGAVCIHVDESLADAAYGERYTAVYSGARKIDGWPHAPLSEGAASAMQKGVDHCRDMFAQVVGRQGRMTSADAIATEAAMYNEADAVLARLADRVGSFDEALLEISSIAKSDGRDNRAALSTAARQNSKGETEMKTPKSATETSVAALSLPPAAQAPAAAAPAASDAPAPDAAAAPAAAPRTDPAVDGDDGCPNTPAPGETCGTCGQTMPGDKPAAQADAAAVHTEVSAILDLCATQGVSLAAAGEFIKAKTPLASVREKIAADKAKAADQLQTTATPKEAVVNAGWDDVTAKVNKEFGVKPK